MQFPVAGWVLTLVCVRVCAREAPGVCADGDLQQEEVDAPRVRAGG